jgi:hypothetical protein
MDGFVAVVVGKECWGVILNLLNHVFLADCAVADVAAPVVVAGVAFAVLVVTTTFVVIDE